MSIVRAFVTTLWHSLPLSTHRGRFPKVVRAQHFLVLLCLATTPAVAIDILVDQGHGQRFVIERQGTLELSQLASRWRDMGHVVDSTRDKLTVARLAPYDLLVISGAFAPFSTEERQAIQRFVWAGGVVLLALHVGPLNGPLLADFGIAVSTGVVMERANRLNDTGSDFRLAANPQHRLTEGFANWSLYGGWALNPGADADVLARASEAAWMDLNRNRRFDSGEPVAPFVMAAVKHIEAGSLVVLGDDAMLQNRFLSGDNAIFVDRVVQWVASRNN